LEKLSEQFDGSFALPAILASLFRDPNTIRRLLSRVLFSCSTTERPVWLCWKTPDVAEVNKVGGSWILAKQVS
jgi:hypothetical protein